MARWAVGRPRYRPSILPREMTKGLRVFDIRSGFIIYTDQATHERGGYTSSIRGPRFDPRANRVEP